LPVQELGTDLSKRQADSVFSWFATLTPRLGMAADYYVLSIVVCTRRDLSASANYLAARPSGETDNERVVQVNQFYNAFNRGDGTVVSPAGGDIELLTLAGRPPEDFTVSEGNWILLAGRYPQRPPQGTRLDDLSSHPIFKWYRVTGVENIPRVNAGTYLRDVSLQGPDWEINANAPTYAVLVNNVVAVYEKTIRIQTSTAFDY
jgi:hypothetical protein